MKMQHFLRTQEYRNLCNFVQWVVFENLSSGGNVENFINKKHQYKKNIILSIPFNDRSKYQFDDLKTKMLLQDDQQALEMVDAIALTPLTLKLLYNFKPANILNSITETPEQDVGLFTLLLAVKYNNFDVLNAVMSIATIKTIKELCVTEKLLLTSDIQEFSKHSALKAMVNLGARIGSDKIVEKCTYNIGVLSKCVGDGVNMSDNQGISGLVMQPSSSKKEFEQNLATKDGYNCPAIFYTLYNRDIKTFQNIIANINNYNILDADGNNLLHYIKLFALMKNIDHDTQKVRDFSEFLSHINDSCGESYMDALRLHRNHDGISPNDMDKYQDISYLGNNVVIGDL